MNKINVKDENMIKLFKNFYPDIPVEGLEDELFEDMLGGIYNQIITSGKFNIEPGGVNLIEKNFIKANNLIPEMIVPTDLIYLKGRLGGTPVNILFDSGAQSSTTFKSITDKAGLDHIIDKDAKSYTIGVNNVSINYGTIWYTDLELEIEKDKYVNIPISLNVDDDTEINKKLEEIKKDDDTNNDNNTDSKESYERKTDILLGINFMKAYKVIIDFSKRTIILNDSITIHYN